MSLAFLSFAITTLLIVLGQMLFRQLGWMDKPHLYGYVRKPVPYGMGIVFFVVFLSLGLFFLKWDAKVIALLVSGGILSITCFLDDRIKLSAGLRLMIQIFCALVVVLAGVGIPAISNPFGDPIVLDSVVWIFDIGETMIRVEPLADLVALLWIVFVINAMNWLDGAPGIVSGISTIACMVLFLLATMSDLHVIDQSTLSTMALIIGGASLAFLVFDFPQPQVLMGDSGAMFLGLMVAAMAIFSGGKLATAFIVLAFPILDALWTILRRIANKQSPFKGDFQHFHHELMRAGLSERQVNVFYYLVSMGFGYAALYLESMGKLVAIIILFAIMVTVRMSLGMLKRRIDRK